MILETFSWKVNTVILYIEDVDLNSSLIAGMMLLLLSSSTLRMWI